MSLFNSEKKADTKEQNAPVSDEEKAIQVLKDITKKKHEAFFKEYLELCKKHGIQIGVESILTTKPFKND